MDTTPPPGNPPDTTAPPPDSTVPPPPPDTTPPAPPTPTHVGIGFGPYHAPRDRFDDWSGTIYTATNADTLLLDLEVARGANARLLISFVGNERHYRDSSGFNLDLWKQRVDRFRGLDLTPYIADGTIIGHFLMDEPDDRTNWNGHVVAKADIEAMAAYSKQVWPTMPTLIRSKTEYLLGHQYPHLDAVGLQYHSRFGPIGPWIQFNIENAAELGVAMTGGLNVLDGGTEESGIPGLTEGRYGMSPDQIRSWGGTFLSDAPVCAFFLWRYKPAYLDSPEIKAAVDELGQQARSLPNRACRR